jgi:hypothetical protein
MFHIGIAPKTSRPAFLLRCPPSLRFIKLVHASSTPPTMSPLWPSYRLCFFSQTKNTNNPNNEYNLFVRLKSLLSLGPNKGTKQQPMPRATLVHVSSGPLHTEPILYFSRSIAFFFFQNSFPSAQNFKTFLFKKKKLFAWSCAPSN